ncbi:hypothetical protein Tco_0942922 [Tanacetum coccineum]
MAPRAVLMKTGLKFVNTAKPVNTIRSVNTGRPFSTARSFNTVRPSYTAHPKSTIHCARPRIYFQNQAQSTVHRPFYKRTTLTKRWFNQRFNTGRPFRSTVNTVRAKGFNVVKPSACWVWRPIKPNGASLSNSQLNDKGFVDSGCSTHMTGNIAHLSDFKDFDGDKATNLKERIFNRDNAKTWSSSPQNTVSRISCLQKGYDATDSSNQGELASVACELLHEHHIKSSVKMQSQDIQISSVQAMDDSLIVSKGSLIEPENNNAFSKSETKTQMQRQEEKVNMREAVNVGNRRRNDDEPFAEVQLTALHNILANEQQHTEQSEPNYDTHLLETTIDSNTTPTSTNMCHRGGEIDQDALLKTELLKTKDMVDKEIYNELSKRFLQLEKHCISLEIQIQQKEESFQSNKPCKDQEFPDFREFFVINDLKAQLLARTTLICNLKKQIKSVKETSNEAKVKNNIDVIETINIELEHSVAKLLAANEQLHKENEHLKQTYKELFDSIKKTKVQNKDNSESLISQINQKSVENADLKAQLQEKFAKASILGKPPLQPSRNHLVVRQPNAFTSERPRISRPRFASQVDEKNDLSKTVTPHYLPKVRESAAAKPHQVNAPNYSRNSHKESYGSNDMVHAYFLEDARKMTQDKTRIPSHKDMASTRAHCTPNACTPKPRNIYRSSPVSKCSGGMSNGTSNSSAGTSVNPLKERLGALFFILMTLDHNSSSLSPQCLMMSVHISSGLVSPKSSHLLVVKRIFRYLKGKPSLGLWYSKDSPLELVAYTDSDYAGATQDRKLTTGGCQLLGNRLISWKCKKQTVVATSTSETEYVATASCCGQVLWIQNQLLDYGYNFMNTVIYIDNNSTICIIENPVQHSKTKHIEIRHHFIRDCNAKKLIQMVKINTEHNVADLLTKGFDAGRF